MIGYGAGEEIIPGPVICGAGHSIVQAKQHVGLLLRHPGRAHSRRRKKRAAQPLDIVGADPALLLHRIADGAQRKTRKRSRYPLGLAQQIEQEIDFGV